MITLRTPVSLMRRIDVIAKRRQVTRSALVAGVLEAFIAEIQNRGYLIPPYEGDEILRDVRLYRRRQAELKYYFARAPRKFRS